MLLVAFWKDKLPIKESAEAKAGFYLKGYVEDSALGKTFDNISYKILINQIFKNSVGVNIQERRGKNVFTYLCCLVAKSHLTLLQPHGLWTTRLLSPQHFPGKNTGVGCHFLSPGGFPDPRIKLCIAGRFFTTEPPRKPFTYLSISENILPTFESP